MIYRDEINQMKSNYWNLIKIIRAIFKKITILYFGDHLKSLSFWSWNIQIYWAFTYGG
jgi:hypothetical protein